MLYDMVIGFLSRAGSRCKNMVVSILSHGYPWRLDDLRGTPEWLGQMGLSKKRLYLYLHVRLCVYVTRGYFDTKKHVMCLNIFCYRIDPTDKCLVHRPVSGSRPLQPAVSSECSRATDDPWPRWSDRCCSLVPQESSLEPSSLDPSPAWFNRSWRLPVSWLWVYVWKPWCPVEDQTS